MNKHRWPGWSSAGSLILPDVATPPPKPLRIGALVFAPQPELHVTLIGRALGAELRRTFDAAWLEARVQRAFEALDWDARWTGRWLHLHAAARLDRGPLDTVVELLEFPAMARFHAELGALLGRTLPVPPPHVTLYSTVGGKGIGLPSPQRLRAVRVRELDAAALAHQR